jgi:hypothetical protein
MVSFCYCSEVYDPEPAFIYATRLFVEVPATDAAGTVLTNASNMTAAVNGNNSTILSLLANTSAQSSPSSSAANITLSNLLTSVAGARTLSAGQTVNVGGQRVVAKRLKMPANAATARMLSANQQVATSLGNATVIAAATGSVTTTNAQPVIRLSLSSLQNQVRVTC